MDELFLLRKACGPTLQTYFFAISCFKERVLLTHPPRNFFCIYVPALYNV